MKSKIPVGIFLVVLYYLSFKYGKVKLLASIIFYLSIMELTVNFIKFHKTNKQNTLLYVFALSSILVCKKIINKMSDKEIGTILVNTIINDTFQELFGKLFGKTKITNISPNKTLEGYIGGILGLFILNKTLYKKKYTNTILIYLSNIFGDLFFSNIKRKYKIKDFSKILLNHGGILDRYDSIIFGIIMNYFIKMINLC